MIVSFVIFLFFVSVCLTVSFVFVSKKYKNNSCDCQHLISSDEYEYFCDASRRSLMMQYDHKITKDEYLDVILSGCQQINSKFFKVPNLK